MNAAARRVAPFPWQTVEAIDRRAVRVAGKARRVLARAVDATKIEAALSDVVGSPVEIVIRGVVSSHSVREKYGTLLGFEVGDGGVAFELNVEHELGAALVGRVLGRAPRLSAPNAALDPALGGALAAIVVESARRTEGMLPLRFLDGGRGAVPASDDERAVVYATLLLDGRPYELSAVLRASPFANERDTNAVSFARLGKLEIAVPLVAGLGAASRDEVESLAPGDVWLPGDGWWVSGGERGSITGMVALAAPTSENGVRAELRQGGEIVLRDESIVIAVDADAMTDENRTQSTELGEQVLDAPVLIRVELGSVSMPARDWAALGPGDVIETGRRVAEPVVLRVAGRAVAEGDLVSVEGELGVRVRRLLTESDGR
ncbi:MAG TPA: FliM/FliN family flagellar motor switch protein [Polyangiaceae bacterium]